MRIVILYRPNSEYEREITDYVREYEHRNPESKVELLSLDTREGDDLAATYDIMENPAILVLSDDGQLLKFWSGMPLPLMNEVAAYQAS